MNPADPGWTDQNYSKVEILIIKSSEKTFEMRKKKFTWNTVQVSPDCREEMGLLLLR